MIEEYIGAPGAELPDTNYENGVISAFGEFWTPTSNFEEPKEIRYTYFCENVDTYNSVDKIPDNSQMYKTFSHETSDSITNIDKKFFSKILEKEFWKKKRQQNYREYYSNKSLDPVLNETGKKESEGKTDYSEINLGILDIMAERFNANKHKYPKGNMKKPIEVDSLLWAAFRHLKKMIKPLKDDQEDFKQHLAAVLCNMSMVLDQIELKDEDKI